MVDLWTPFLKARAEAADTELFQRQDTHWTSRGLDLAASVIAERIARYPWAKQLAQAEAHHQGRRASPATAIWSRACARPTGRA